MEKQETAPFRKINTVFPILKLPQAHEIESIPPKVGELELEISSSFDAATKLKLNKGQPKSEPANQTGTFEANKLEKKRKELYEKKAQERPPAMPGDSENNSQNVPAKAGFYKRNLDPLEAAIEKALALKNNLLMAETNQNLELGKQLDRDLHDGASLNLLLDPPRGEGRPQYKDTELERLRLALQQPEIEAIVQTRAAAKGPQEKYSLDMAEIEKLKLVCHSFVPEHDVLADRLKGAKLVMQVRLPKFYDKTVMDTLEFSLEEKSGKAADKGEFLMHKEIKNLYSVKEIGVERIAKSSIQFNLQIKIPNKDEQPADKLRGGVHKTPQGTQKADTTDKTPYTTLSIAKAVLSLGDVLQQKNFEFKGQVPFDSLVALDRKKNEFVVDADKKPKPGKAKPAKKEEILPQNVGYLNIDCSFINENIVLVPLPEPPKPSEEDLKREEDRVKRLTLQKTKLETDHRLKQQPLLPVCLFVHVLRANKISDRDDSRFKRNLFIQHKLYGTPDDITSPVFWNQSNPEIDHRVLIPLSRQTIELMKDAPLTISVWDKQEPPKADELIGTVHVNLKSAYSLLWPLSEEDLRAMLAKHDLNLLELSNKYMAVERLASCREAGFLKVYVALGNIHQINEYNMLHPANNSRMLGVDPSTFDFNVDDALIRKRDLSRKKRVRLNDLQKAMLERDPAAKHLANTLIAQLNDGEIEMDKFLHELNGLMSRHPDVRIVDILKSIERDAELCNPFESIDTSRKNYLRLGDKQLVYDSLTKKYMQIWGEGQRTQLDKCNYRTREGNLQLLFVDPELIKVKRDIKGTRMLTNEHLAKLKKLGKQYLQKSEAEARAIKAAREEKRLVRIMQAKMEEERMEREIQEAERKLEESKALIKTAKLLEKEIRLKEQKEAEEKRKLEEDKLKDKAIEEILKNKINLPIQESSPLAGHSPKSSKKGWDIVRNKMNILNKEAAREDESYGSPSHRSVMITSRSKKEKMFINLGGTDDHEEKFRPGSNSSIVISKTSPQPDSPRSIFKEQKLESSHRSGSNRFNVVQVGMVLDHYAPIYESSEDTSEENLRLKNINLIEKTEEEEEYDPTIKVPQYATKIEDDIECSDIILNFTFILECMRRTIIQDEKLFKNLKYLLLGQFQSQMFKTISLADMEYIMEQYQVSTSTSELQSVFNFLDIDKTGSVSLIDIHDSLVAYMLLYRRYQRQYEGTFKYLMDKIHNQTAGLDPLIQFLTIKSDKYHIETRKLSKFFKDEYLVHDIDMIESQLREYGEYLYFDQVYIYNVLNVLSFLNASPGGKCNPQKINGIHHYESFLPLILLKIRERATKLYGEENALEQIRLKLTESNQKTEIILQGSARILRRQTTNEFDDLGNQIKNPIKLNFALFGSLFQELGLVDLSIYERMIVFYFIYDLKLKMRHTIAEDQQISMQEVYIFFQLVVGENPEEVQKQLGRRIVGSLASFLNREKMFQLKITPVHSRSSSISGQKRSKLLTRRKLKPDLIATDRVLYRITVNVQGIEELRLGHLYDYTDFSLSFTFPGEPERFESQIFTYIPRESEYDVLLNTEHTFRCSPDLDISAIFENKKAIRLSVNKINKSKSEEVSFCLIPIAEILSQEPKSRKYFLYANQTEAGVEGKLTGAVKVALAFFSGPEKLTEKDYFFSKQFMIDNQVVEKDVVFEREIPTKGYLVIQVGSIKRLEGFYNLLDWVKRTCRFTSQNSRYTISFLIKISELQKPQTGFRKKALPGVIEEVLNEDSESGTEFKDKPSPSLHEPSTPKKSSDALFQEYVIELRTANLGSLEALFSFIDSFASKSIHHVFNTSVFELQIVPETLSLLESSELDVGIYLGCSGQNGYQETRICGKTLSCYQFLTVQNLDGIKNPCKLTNDTFSALSAELDVILNYSKVYLNEFYVEQLNRFKEMENFLELLRPLIVLVDITQLLKLPEREPEKVYFVKCAVGNSLIESTMMIPADRNRVVEWTKLVPEDSHNLLDFRLSKLVDDIKLSDLYEKYKAANEAVDIQTFLLSCLPELTIELKEHSVDGVEITRSSMTLKLRILVRQALDSNLLPSCIVFKGYLPLSKHNKFDETVEESSDLEQDFSISGNNSRLLRNSKVNQEASSPDKSQMFNKSQRSLKQINVFEKQNLKPVVIDSKRLGLKIFFVSNKGLINNEALEGFKLLIKQPWVKSTEEFLKKLPEENPLDSETFQMRERGFVVQKEVFKQVISKELDVGLVMASSVIDLLGCERHTTNMAKLHHLLCFPLDSNHSLKDTEFPEKLAKNLLKEFRHLDMAESGYVPFGEAVKLIMNFASVKVTMKQLQIFKYSDLMKDFKDVLPKGVISTLEKQGFDYLVFLNELLEVQRRRVLKEGHQKSKMPLQYHLAQIDQEEERLAKAYNTLEATLKPSGKPQPRSAGLQDASFIDRKENRYTFLLTIESGTNLEEIASDQYPSTSVAVINNLSSWPGKVQGSSDKVISQTILRDPEPEWMCSISAEIQNLDKFRQENLEAYFEVEVYERTLNVQKVGSDLFNTNCIARCRVHPFKEIAAHQLAAFALSPQQFELLSERLFKLNSTQAAVKVALRLMKAEGNLAATLPINKGELQDRDLDLVKKTFEDIQHFLPKTIELSDPLHDFSVLRGTTSKIEEFRSSDFDPPRLSEQVKNFKEAMRDIDDFISGVGNSANQEKLPSVSSFDRFSNAGDHHPADQPREPYFGRAVIPFLHSNSNYSLKDPHNDTAKFGEASANELITLQVPNPAQMSKRGSIFLRMEDRSPTSPAFLMHQASGQFSDVWHHAGQQSSSKAEDNSRNSLQPGEDPFDEVKEQEDSSFDEHHA